MGHIIVYNEISSEINFPDTEVWIMGKGIFGGMFDFNGDGKMSAFELAAEFQFFHDVVMAEESDDELTAAGLDKDELRWMDADERREALEDAGLDPSDFDEDF